MDEDAVYRKHVAKNSRRIFKLHQDYSLLELKERYKQLLRTHHPDKGGDRESFLYITACFKYLYRDLERRSEKTFDELKKNARSESTSLPPPPKTLIEDREHFSEKFNAFYEKHGIPDSTVQRGYEEFMSEATVQADDQSNFKLQKYRPPSPQHLCGKMHFMTLGDNQEGDFSGKNDVKNGLQFMDYRRAHTTSRLVDESLLQDRESFSSLEDIKTKRETANFEMKEDEERRYHKENRLQTRDELERQARLKRHDQHMFKHFDSVRRMQIV